MNIGKIWTMVITVMWFYGRWMAYRREWPNENWNMYSISGVNYNWNFSQYRDDKFIKITNAKLRSRRGITGSTKCDIKIDKPHTERRSFAFNTIGWEIFHFNVIELEFHLDVANWPNFYFRNLIFCRSALPYLLSRCLAHSTDLGYKCSIKIAQISLAINRSFLKISPKCSIDVKYVSF